MSLWAWVRLGVARVGRGGRWLSARHAGAGTEIGMGGDWMGSGVGTVGCRGLGVLRCMGCGTRRTEEWGCEEVVF